MRMNNLFFIIFVFFLNCVIPETSAEKIIYIKATSGGNVTLLLPKTGINQNIIDVTWIRAGGKHFATTFPDGEVDIRDAYYDGRLRGSTDSSLTIINVTSGDGGIYAANVLHTDGDNYVQKYHLGILEKSPDPVTRDVHESPMVDVCSVTCRRNGISVTLTCDQTSHQDMTMYDPDTCTCTAWKEDCAPCVLDKYCRKGGVIRPIAAEEEDLVAAVATAELVVLVMLVLLLVICVKYC